MRTIYLDYNATTPVHPDVEAAMRPFHREHYGNPSSIHRFGTMTRAAIDRARKTVAALIGAAKPGEIIFTSGGTEADNLAIQGVAHALRAKGNHIVTSAVEHSAVLNTCKFLEDGGYRVTYVAVDKYGLVDCKQLERALCHDTILISVMLANNEIGTIEPVQEIGQIAKKMGIAFHTDAVQAIGKMPVSVNDLNVDLLSLSGHKIYGPKGIGALYLSDRTLLTPMMRGGPHEINKRAGTENLTGIVGLGKAAELAEAAVQENSSTIRALRDRLEKGILDSIREVRVNGHPEKRLTNTLNVAFRGVEGESVVMNLDLEGIAVSAGAACTSGSVEVPHVLAAMGLSREDAQGSVRLSLGHFTTGEDIACVLKVLPPLIARLRAQAQKAR